MLKNVRSIFNKLKIYVTLKENSCKILKHVSINNKKLLFVAPYLIFIMFCKFIKKKVNNKKELMCCN